MEDRFEVCCSLERLKKSLSCRGNEAWPVPEGFAVASFFFFGLTPPSSWSQKKRERAYGKAIFVKPDTSNLTYFLDNRLEGYFITNDNQINPCYQQKVYSSFDYIMVGLAYEPSNPHGISYASFCLFLEAMKKIEVDKLPAAKELFVAKDPRYQLHDLLGLEAVEFM